MNLFNFTVMIMGMVGINLLITGFTNESWLIGLIGSGLLGAWMGHITLQ